MKKSVELYLLCFSVLFCVFHPKMAFSSNQALKVLKDYTSIGDMPLMVKVSESKQMRIHFVNTSKCYDYGSSSDKPINIENAQRALNVVHELEQQFLKLNDIGGVEWIETAEKKLYPIDVMININIGIEGSKAGKRWSLTPCEENDNTKDYGGPRYHILNLGANFDLKEKGAALSILQHELGHVIQYAFGYPQWFIWSEVYADIFAMILNDWSPYIGKGSKISLGNERISLKEFRVYLMSMHQKAIDQSKSQKKISFIEEKLKTMSDLSLRDFTIKLPYTDMFKYPQSHNISSYLSPAFYEYAQLGYKMELAKSFLDSVRSKSKHDFSIDPFNAFSASLNLPKQYLLNQGWGEASLIDIFLTPEVHEISLDADESNREGDYIYKIDARRNAKIIIVKPNDQLISKKDNSSVSPLISSLSSSNKSLWHGLADITADSNSIRLALLPVIDCAEGHQSCQCFDRKVTLELFSMFMNKDNVVSKFKQDISLNNMDGCYALEDAGLGYDWSGEL